MKRAFILHRRAQDTSEIGMKVDDTKIVIDGKFYPFDPGEIYAKIQEAMSHFDTDDVIVPCGSNLICFLAGFFLGSQKNPKKLKLLVHDVRNNKYRDVIFIPEK